jgi:hypothetical protein
VDVLAVRSKADMVLSFAMIAVILLLIGKSQIFTVHLLMLILSAKK